MALIKHQRQVSYPMGQVWPTAIRYLRVERGFEIEDRDRDSGYVVFRFDHGDSTGSGAVEFFEGKDSAGRVAVTMISSTNRGPAHLPFSLLEGIASKLQEERGQPAPPPAPPVEAPEEDAEDDPNAPDDTQGRIGR